MWPTAELELARESVWTRSGDLLEPIESHRQHRDEIAARLQAHGYSQDEVSDRESCDARIRPSHPSVCAGP
jgi:hypothetical protein